MAAWIRSINGKIMDTYYAHLLESADLHNQDVTLYY